MYMSTKGRIHIFRPSPGRRAPAILPTGALVALLFALGLGACEAGPTEPGADADALTAQALNENWSAFPSMEALHLIAAGGLAGATHLGAGTVEIVVGAGLIATETGDLRRGPGAHASAAAFDAQWWELTGAVLGLDQARSVTDALEVALVNVEAAMERRGGNGVGVRAAAAARIEARRRLAAARAALARGNAGDALAEASAGGDALRSLLPERRAAALVASAQELLARAVALAGDNPSQELAALLEEATAACRAAETALDAGNWEAAVREARICARLARVVIARLSGGISEDLLAERAQAMVEQAESLLERAVEKAGPNPSEPVASALEEAKSLLDAARAALGAGDYREAIRAAQASAALSRRVLAAGRDPGEGEELEARARAVVEAAQALLPVARELAGSDPSPAVLAFLADADALLSQAGAALEAGDWRQALLLGHEAMSRLRRAIVLLQGA